PPPAMPESSAAPSAARSTPVCPPEITFARRTAPARITLIDDALRAAGHFLAAGRDARVRRGLAAAEALVERAREIRIDGVERVPRHVNLRRTARGRISAVTSRD